MAVSSKTRALVLGVGNVLLGDDGLGVRAAELFNKTYDLPGNVECIDGGTAGVNLLSTIEKFNHVIIIDAVSSGSPPATVHRFGPEDLGSAPRGTTAHGLGVKELLALARFDGARPEITLIGVVPRDVNPGVRLSPPVAGALPEAARMAAEVLCSLGYEAKKREDARDVDN